MRCIDVAESAGRWDLVEESVLRAFAAVDVGRVLNEDLVEAAQKLVDVFLSRVPRGDLDALRLAAEQAEQRIDREAGQMHAPPVAEALLGLKERLREVLMLLSDTEQASYISLCSRLRKLNRPDLGRVAATRCLSRYGPDDKAFTTRGAASADEGDYDSALGDLREAWKIAPSSYVATAAARCLRATGRLTEALRTAEQAVDFELSPVTAGAYVAAAVAADDTDALKRAQTLLAQTEDVDQGDESSRWAFVLGAKVLLQDGLLTSAREALERVLAEGPYEPAERLLRRLERDEAQSARGIS